MDTWQWVSVIAYSWNVSPYWLQSHFNWKTLLTILLICLFVDLNKETGFELNIEFAIENGGTVVVDICISSRPHGDSAATS